MSGTGEVDGGDPISAATFTLHVGTSFDVGHLDQQAAPVTPLTLRTVEERGDVGASGRQPFALLFTTPVRDAMSQGTYLLRHETLGELAVFLVPIGPDGDVAMRYEAIFA